MNRRVSALVRYVMTDSLLQHVDRSLCLPRRSSRRVRRTKQHSTSTRFRERRRVPNLPQLSRATIMSSNRRWSKAWQLSFERALRLATAATIVLALTVTTAAAQHECRVPIPLSVTTLSRILRTVPWDSVCDGGCKNFIVDSTVRVVASPGVVPQREPIYFRFTGPARNVVSPLGHKALWGKIDVSDHPDTTLIALARL